MTAKPQKSCQFKRDYPQLINLYPPCALTTAQSLDNSTRLRRSRLTTPSAQLGQGLYVMGQWGLGDGLELLSLLHHWQTQTQSNTRLLVKVFEPNPINDYELKLLWDQSQSLISQPHLQPIAYAILKAKPARIIGCQRLIFDDGRITVDLHFGDLHTSLTNLPHSPAHPIQQWLVLPHLATQLNSKLVWQMARLSDDDTQLIGVNLAEIVQQLARSSGFSTLNVSQDALNGDTSDALQSQIITDEILLHERKLLRQQADTTQAFTPKPAKLATKEHPVAIIGGGLASANLMLSLAERGQSSILFCKDNELGQGASGNRQGAIYPLLTPENDELSRFFQQAFLFSRRRIEALSHASMMETDTVTNVTAISHDFCGVLQTGHDERSQQRLDKIIQSQDWPAEIAYAVDANKANEIAQIGIDKAGFFYPLGGWVCPFEYAKAAVDKASQLADVQCHFNTEITEIECDAQAWYLHSQGQRFGPFSQLVLANGAQLTQFSASERLQISPFRGQVSHVPAQFRLSQLATVLCANGYLTPSHQGLHCLGASYVKAAEHLDFCPQEQLENLGKMQQSYPNQAWVDDIDISGNSARVGVRMVTRDHFPMMGCAPDVAEILARYEQHQLNQQQAEQSKHYWQTTPAPILDGLYILGGLGSRGLSSGPLAAECLAAQLTGEPLPLDWPTLNKLSPNRMWLRKLLKGKAL
ncbi:FAD-dependent 5-carboxymethylaminomethyl-2-thiouridine(34) oxidoreductase MnmC [Shewanella decolorationis]|uniref:tRNA 5-methylaminomethyl-2-thiouridine biosynthesis bifunctional protein MnmC n=1 Tax=Shewanella decolorationis TaxID=256839 RepID=A0A5B8QVI6_9GAMM|nr:FAD-dependent 5-carboxymethylaminomethyl-2-thiouridine(34) oxidoreductase MnmC [Shewanella decolorationis]QDZ90494.1 FAD-dependent 5-carboxymethylaminomethyl-2-thiouridine(34) oxidoreductase MnmC [Shewanella decolorationis]